MIVVAASLSPTLLSSTVKAIEGVASLSMIVMAPVGAAMVAFVALLSLNTMVSSASSKTSPITLNNNPNLTSLEGSDGGLRLSLRVGFKSR